MTIEQAATEDSRLRIMHGGPFHDLMAALGLRHRAWRGFVLGSVCWLIPLFLLMATGDGNLARQFLHDWGAWAKFLIAPVLFTLTEKPIGFAIDECTAILFRTPLIASQSMEEARRGLEQARDRTIAWLPEVVCVVLAVAASIFNFQRFESGFAPDWASSAAGLNLAGLWCVVVSNSLYWFLLARLIWKHIIWARFLSSTAGCRLRLAITHPDGHAGLGFISLYPAGYALFTLGFSAVVAAGIGHVMQRETVTPTLFTAVCGMWLVVVFVYFAFPIAGFTREIARLKRRAVLLSMAKATDFERKTERSLMGENIFEDDSEPNAEELRDVKPLYQASVKTSALLINKHNVLPILAPALLPLLVVGASYLSYSQLGPIVRRLLFL